VTSDFSRIPRDSHMFLTLEVRNFEHVATRFSSEWTCEVISRRLLWDETTKIWGLIHAAVMVPATRALAGEVFEALALNIIAQAVKTPSLYTFKAKRLNSDNTSSQAQSVCIADFLQSSLAASFEPIPTSAVSSSSASSSSFSAGAEEILDCTPEPKMRRLDQIAKNCFPDFLETLPQKLDPALGCVIFDNLEEVKGQLRPGVLFIPSYRTLAAAAAFYPPNTVFQGTNSLTHPELMRQLLDGFSLIGSCGTAAPRRLVFFVSSAAFDRFGFQSFSVDASSCKHLPFGLGGRPLFTEDSAKRCLTLSGLSFTSVGRLGNSWTKEKLKSIVETHGGKWVDKPEKASHVITTNDQATNHANWVCWVVKPEWLTLIADNNLRLVKEKQHLLREANAVLSPGSGDDSKQSLNDTKVHRCRACAIESNIEQWVMEVSDS